MKDTYIKLDASRIIKNIEYRTGTPLENHLQRVTIEEIVKQINDYVMFPTVKERRD